jgi:hypothetical protein
VELLEHAAVICEALLAVAGGLAILSRYTKLKLDDKIFGTAEEVLKKVKELLPSKEAKASEGGEDAAE